MLCFQFIYNMATANDKNCTFLVCTEKSGVAQQEDICKHLESNDNAVKCKGIQEAIISLLAGETMPRILMTIIRYCVTNDDHQVKKMLMLYWELVPKYGADNKLLPEMILVCNALRNDIMSPNEFIRGCSLRFLCKLKEQEILEPLIPSIKQALTHRHSYVRRNAVLTVHSIYSMYGEAMLPDGPELMANFIATETDMSARRNAFLMLFHGAEQLAIEFLTENADNISKYGDSFALIALELSRKTCRRDPSQKARFLKSLFQLLQSNSNAVAYEAAWTLISLSTAPTAVRNAAQTFTKLLLHSSDNNIKLIVLDRLIELKTHHNKVVQEIIMDILRALATPNIDICKKTLDLAVDLVNPRNIEEVMATLKKEVIRVQDADLDFKEEYKRILIQAIHKCALKFAEVVDTVVLVLLEFLSGDGGVEVMKCVKSVMEQYPDLRSTILEKLISNFSDISNAEAYRIALWIFGEYAHSGNIDEESDVSEDVSLLLESYRTVREHLGDAPYTTPSAAAAASEGAAKEAAAVAAATTKNVVLKDGTYASVTTNTSAAETAAKEAASIKHLRKLVVTRPDVLLGTCACVCLTKLNVKLLTITEFNKDKRGAKTSMQDTNKTTLETLQCCAGIASLAENKRAGRVGVYADSLSRLSQCCRILLDSDLRSRLADVFLFAGQEAYSDMVETQREARQTQLEVAKKTKFASKVDDLIQFRQLRSQVVQGGIEVDLMDADDISRAVGGGAGSEDDLSAPLLAKGVSANKHIYQLSGYSDPVYAEASLTVHDYDIILEILIINRTPDTLTNLTVELATVGDLKIVERPQSYNIGPLDERKLRANIKVSSTETSHIFGTIVFDNSATAQKTYVQLNDIQLDIMDYIRAATCKHEEFRNMWAEFEWENKVAIHTNISTMKEFLNHIITHTNMTCMNEISDSELTSNFLAANLYAKSVFGEDALVNISVERKDDANMTAGDTNRLVGYIRIRSKTQGIALSLGDRITAIQRITQGFELKDADDAAPEPSKILPTD